MRISIPKNCQKLVRLGTLHAFASAFASAIVISASPGAMAAEEDQASQEAPEQLAEITVTARKR